MTASRIGLGVVIGILTAGAPASAQSPSQPLAVHVSLDADQIPTSGRVKAWIVIDNKGADAVDGVRFDTLQLRGFERIGGCWTDSTPACPPGSETASNDDSIEGSSQQVRWAEFRRVDEEPGQSFLLGLLRAANRTTDVEFTTTVTAGPVQRLSGLASLIPLATVATPALLAAIALLGTILTVSAQILLQKRTERGALFTTLLPKNLENAEKYYLPIQTAIERLADAAKPPVSNVDSLTFHWLLLSRRMRELNKCAGGFYFKSHLGEELAADAWKAFKIQEFNQDTAAPKAISTALVYQVVGKFETTSNFGDFQEARVRSATFATDVNALQDGLTQWVNTASSDSWTFALTCVKILNVVLGFEINRPHERWYVDSYRREPGVKTLQELQKELLGLNLAGVNGAVKARDGIVNQVEEYVTKAWRHGGVALLPSMPQ